jgi:hypothetical protein
MVFREMEFTMSTALVLSEFTMFAGAALIAVRMALRLLSLSHPGKADSHKLSKAGAFHV